MIAATMIIILCNKHRSLLQYHTINISIEIMNFSSIFKIFFGNLGIRIFKRVEHNDTKRICQSHLVPKV